jgi:hypothetical protein
MRAVAPLGGRPLLELLYRAKSRSIRRFANGRYTQAHDIARASFSGALAICLGPPHPARPKDSD